MKRKLQLILVLCVILCTFCLSACNRESKYFYYLSATERNDAFVKMFDRNISVKHEYFIDLNEKLGDNGAYLLNVQTASNDNKGTDSLKYFYLGIAELYPVNKSNLNM